MSRDHDLHEQVAAALDGAFVVDEVTITPAGRRRVVRITVERPLDSAVGATPVAPLTLDEVADATRLVSDALDASDVLGAQPYTLEVSSPGIGRPLTTPEHLRRNVGRLVEIDRGGDAGSLTGRVLRTDEDGVTVEIPAGRKTPAREETLAHTDVLRGRVQVEFNRPDDQDDSRTGTDPADLVATADDTD